MEEQSVVNSSQEFSYAHHLFVSVQDWDQHIKGSLHIQKCMAFSDK